METTNATKLTDRHGEAWLLNEDGTYRNENSYPGYLDDWKLQDIERVWGPVRVG
jgi:hypothetical protein